MCSRDKVFTALPLPVKLKRQGAVDPSEAVQGTQAPGGGGGEREILECSFQDQLAVVKDNRFTVGLFF